MRKLWIAGVLVVAFAGLASAQTKVAVPVPAATRIAWDHDGANVDRFELVADNGTPADLGIPAPDAPGVYSVAFPALVPGRHTLVVRACNIAGCAASDPLVVDLVAVPVPPGRLRLVTAGK